MTNSIINQLNIFVKFAAKEISLSKLPKINFVGHSENKYNAFGHSKGNEIWIRITDRHPGDIMRTIAHELIHFKQNHSGKTGKQFREDEANAMAGRIMRKFNITYPSLFKLKAIPSNIKESESMVSTNAMGASSSTTGAGPIDTYDPMLRSFKMLKRKKLSDIIGPKQMRKEITRKDR